jgi:hypothetical protein
MSRKKTSSILFIIVVFSLAINSLFYIISDFYPLLSDTARQACGIKNLIENKTLNSENFYLNFAGIDGQLCLTGKTYVLIRVFASFFAFLTPKISPWLSLYLFYLILLALIPFLVFLITKKIFNDNKTALVSSFFGAFAPFLARSALVHPQNLVGFVLILLFALFFVQYHLTKKKINLFVIFAILAVFPFFHHLSFGVLVLSLTAYFLWVTKKKKLILYLGGAMAVFIIVHFFISKLPAEFVLSILNNGLEGGAFWESSIKKPFWEIPSYLGYLLFAFGILGLMYYSSSDPDGHRGSREVPSKLFVSLFLAPLIFSQLYLIGFNFFSFRIIAFAGLPLIIFSGIGFFYLKDFFIKFGIKKLFFSFSILILLGTAGHYFAYLVSIYKARNIYYIPKSDFIAAVKWLNDHSDKKTVIFTTVERRNRQTASLAYLYKGNVIYFPSVYFANPKISNIAMKRLVPALTQIILRRNRNIFWEKFFCHLTISKKPEKKAIKMPKKDLKN